MYFKTILECCCCWGEGSLLFNCQYIYTVNILKTTSKRVIQRTVESNGHLICNRITDKITKTVSQDAPETALQT